MIFNYLQIKKYKILFDIINDSIFFFSKYCSYPRMSSILVSTMPKAETKIIFITTQQDVLSNQILKKSSAKKIDDFLKTLEKILKKKDD